MADPGGLLEPACIEDHDWELDDAERLSRCYPQAFNIPDLHRRADLQPGQLVKCRFRIITADGNRRQEHGERMWVVVEGRCGDRYVGRLNNQPTSTQSLLVGMTVVFEPRHVLAIHEARISRG